MEGWVDYRWPVTYIVIGRLFDTSEGEHEYAKVVIKILQGSLVTQTVLGGIIIFCGVYVCQKLWKLVAKLLQ